jgi:glyoxylase-like metal-dependent hydrolase (beta-lactamase superfamily II)
MRTLRSLCAGAAALALAVATPAALAQGEAIKDIRLYAFSSGALTLGKGALLNFAPMDPPLTLPVGFFLIRHPKGNVLFDTGNNDKLISDRNWWNKAQQAMMPAMTPEVAIDAQLKKVGLTPNDIAYVVCSHLHLDHGGNVGKFPNSTIVVQKSELQNAMWPEPGTGPAYVVGDVLPLRGASTTSANAQKMLQLEGDLDLFGDGTITIKRWVAHTPGSQMMVVKLKNQGVTILTGDNVYLRENVETNTPPNIVLAYFPSGFYTAFEWIRMMMATQKADYFTAHDPDAFKAMKKAPEFYD